ncbi:MAG: ribonuclease PH [Myxococcota bacterium]|jgi:ribonuclease PH
MARPDGRAPNALRPVSFETGLQRSAAGSVLISFGNTRVICAATIEKRSPRWMKDDGRGWVTGEYAMLPGSGDNRVRRGPNGRATEIQRLIGRSLRGVVDLTALPGHTITVDCDVLDADGGTRTAAITGGWVALYQACQALVDSGAIERMPITRQLAAISVGIVKGEAVLDLPYSEDSIAETDMNVVGTQDGRLIEVQGTAEGAPFDRKELDALLDLAQAGIQELTRLQREVLGLADWPA